MLDALMGPGRNQLVKARPENWGSRTPFSTPPKNVHRKMSPYFNRAMLFFFVGVGLLGVFFFNSQGQKMFEAFP